MERSGGRTRGRGRVRGSGTARSRGRDRPLEQLYEDEEVVPPVVEPIPQVVVRDNGRVIKIIRDMRRVGAPTFHGGFDHMKADSWIQEIEDKYFDAFGCSDVEKVRIVVFFLKDDALYWWRSVKRARDVATLNWEGFVKLFQEKYFPAVVREQLELEFIALVQGDMEVREYEAQFGRLYRYVRPMDDMSLAQKFLRGLRHEIRTIVSALCLSTKEEMYESVVRLEQEAKLHAIEVASRDSQGKGKEVVGSSESTGQRGGFWKKQRTRPQTPARITAAPARTTPAAQARTVPIRQAAPLRCFNCGELGHMSSGCSKPRNWCFSCGQVGHYARDCTHRQSGGQGSQQYHGFSQPYHGYLDDNTQVAVKLLSSSASRGLEQFHSEVNLLMRVHHTNLTNLVGYCDDENNKGLVYEYMARGNLQEYLSDKCSNILTWEGRLHMAIDAAQGLEYLHYGCKPPRIHRDIKTTNILLSENFQAKLSDFGLSRNFPAGYGTRIVTGVAGTPGYLASEYQQLNRLNEKSDVYSFGILLLEIITGRPAVSRMRDRIAINEWVGSIIPRGNVYAIVDPRLKGIFTDTSAWKAVELAMACVSPEANKRPTMSKVVGKLKRCSETPVSKRPEQL